MSFGNFPNFFLDFSEREMNGEEKHFYQFKSFRLDVKERQLLHNNLPVALTPKVFDVLVALVERGGHLVEKDELLKLVWADSFVEEINVARSVHTLRKVLGEDENGNKFIETVAKKGYRFVAEVTEVSEPLAVVGGFLPTNYDASLPTPNPPTTADSSDLARAVAPLVSKPKQNSRIILFAVGFLSAIFLIGLLSFNFQSFSTNPNKIKSIAVLPLKPINTANRDEVYEVGIADSLILRLGSMKGFVVRPLSATRQYADITQDAIAAGREQKVDYVLASNYQIADGKIRITAQLFNVSSGQIEETYKSEKNANNIFATQDAIAGDVGKILSARFNVVSNSPAAKRGTTNEEAYRLYLQGRNLTFNRTGEATRKAVEYFEQAIKLDPNYALAYSGMAHAFIMSSNLGGNLPRVEYEKAKQAVTTALELDNNLAEGYAVRGELKFTSEWDFAGAEKDLLRAVELEPNSDLAYERYAFYLAVRGRFDEAIAESKTAQEINPNSLQHQQIGAVILYLARRYTEAVTQFKQIIEVNENHATAYSWLFLVFDVKGDDAAAYEWFLKNQKRTNAPHLAAFQTAYETSGWQGVRQKNLELEKLNENPSTNYYGMARQCALLGEKEQAFEYLNKAIEKRQGQLIMLNVEPSFDALRDDPRFDELVGRVGLK